MLYLKMGCILRLQERTDLKKSYFFGSHLFANGGVGKLFDNVNFWPPFFKELLISQDRDGQPTIKFHRQHKAVHIYWPIPRNKHFCVVCCRERNEKPPKSDWLEWYQKGKSSKQSRLSRYQSIDKKHFWVSGKFEGALSIPFPRNMSAKKVGLFPNVCPFF
jgi:hypothetical protein